MLARTDTHRVFFLATLTLLVLGPTAGAAAQSINHQFKLGLETRMFRFMSVTIEGEDSNFQRETDQIEFGLFTSNSFVSNSLSEVLAVPAAVLGADLAYGLSSSVLLGSRLMFDYGHQDDDDLSLMQIAFVPHLDYVFSTGRSFRPFLGAQLGVQTASISRGSVDQSGTCFLLGASLGAFGFVSNALSIDPRLSFLYSIGSTELEGIDADINSISIALMVGISGWL